MGGEWGSIWGQMGRGAEWRVVGRVEGGGRGDPMEQLCFFFKQKTAYEIAE